MDPETTGTSTPVAAESSVNLTPAEMQEFEKTGEVPARYLQEDTTAKPDEAAASTTDSATKDGSAPPDADTKDTEPTPRLSRSQRRELRNSQEKDALQARITALEQQLSTRKAAEVQQPPASGAKFSEPKPKLDQFDTFEAYDDAKDAWADRKAAFERKTEIQAILARERAEAEAKRVQAEAVTSAQKHAQTFVKRIDDYRKTLKEDTFVDDFAEWKDFIDARKNMGHVADAVLESDFGPHMITYFADHWDELEKLGELSVTGGLKAILTLENSEKIRGAVPKKHTDAKRLTPDVGGNGSAVDEDAELEAIAARGDAAAFDRYMTKHEKRKLAELRR